MQKLAKNSKRPRGDKIHQGLWIHGYSGRMGQELIKAISKRSDEFSLVGGSARTSLLSGRRLSSTALCDEMQDADCIIDFSTPAAGKVLRAALLDATFSGKKVVIGTTGLSALDQSAWRKLALKRRLTILFAPNTSLGVLATLQAILLLQRMTSGQDFDIEVVETHHRRKKDSPSGTGFFFAEALAKGPGLKIAISRKGQRLPSEIGLVSVRGGGVFGEHQVRFLSEHEEVSVTHRAFGRGLFANGALVLCQWLSQQEPGIYGLKDVDLVGLKQSFN